MESSPQNKVLVSIMIPTYNQAQYIKEAVESALAQTYENLEVVVSDDNSTDNTKEILESFSDPRLKYFRSESNYGRVGNYHHMLYDLIQGEWVVNLDGDDYFTDANFISEAVEIIEKNDVVMVGAKYKIEKVSTGALSNQPSYFDGDDTKTAVLDGFQAALVKYDALGLGHLTSVYNAELARKIGFYERDIITADSESMQRLIMEGDIGFINKHIGIWRYHDQNASQYSKYESFYETLIGINAVKEHAVKLNKNPEDIQTMVNQAMELIFFRVFRKIYQFNDFKELPRMFENMKANKVRKRKIFFTLRGIKKTLIVSLKHPKFLVYLFK